MEPKEIASKDGSLIWKVVEVQYKEEGQKRKIKRAFFTVTCSRCGYRFAASKGNVQARKACPGCAEKPAAVKTDSDGHCISICEIGTVEFIREYQNQHDVSEREAVRQFIETAKAHISPDDPIAEKLTEESVNAKVRRLTGKKKDIAKVCGGSPQGCSIDPATGELLVDSYCFPPEAVCIFSNINEAVNQLDQDTADLLLHVIGSYCTSKRLKMKKSGRQGCTPVPPPCTPHGECHL